MNGFGYYLSAIVAAAVTPAAGDFLQAWRPIEADMIADFAWGTSSAWKACNVVVLGAVSVNDRDIQRGDRQR